MIWLILKIFSIVFIYLEPNVDIEALDIPVNAVATALKDFFSKHLPSLFEKDVMKELEEIACKWFALTNFISFHEIRFDWHSIVIFSISVIAKWSTVKSKFGSQNR